MKKKRQIPASEPAAHGLERAAAHAAGRGNRRQKCRERGYYYLHRHLNNPLLHTSSLLTIHYSLARRAPRLVFIKVSSSVTTAATACIDHQARSLSRHCEAT